MSETEVPTTPGLPDPDQVVDPTHPDNPAEELEPGQVGSPSDPDGPVETPDEDDNGDDGA